MLGERTGYDSDSIHDLATVYENWDGSGVPNGLAGSDIPMPVQVVQVATLAVNAERLMGADAALALVGVRAGHTLSPEVAAALLADSERVLAPLREAGSLWDAVMAAEPTPSAHPSADEVDRALSALGDLADLKSPYLVGHSQGVAELAAAAGRCYGLGDAEVTLLAPCGLRARHRPDRGVCGHLGLHPATAARPVGTRPDAPLLHPASAGPEPLPALAERRRDGTPREAGRQRLLPGLPGPTLSMPARILAAADTYHAKTERRPHREAMSPQESGAHLRSEAKAGRLDSAAVEAVLVAAGQPSARGATAVRLTPREVEILGQVALGGSMREIARALSISPKTVDGHLQRIYPKIGVSTRSGATLYAMDHGLLPAQRNRARASRNGRREEGENSP